MGKSPLVCECTALESEIYPRLLLQIKKSWLISATWPFTHIPVHYITAMRFYLDWRVVNQAKIVHFYAKTASVVEHCAAKRWRPALPCIHTPFLGKNKQHAEMDQNIATYCALNPPLTKDKTNLSVTYPQTVRRNPRVYMNIFNDAARPHRATWLSPFFVVIEFSKAMWHKKLHMIFAKKKKKTSFRICRGRRHLVWARQ